MIKRVTGEQQGYIDTVIVILLGQVATGESFAWGGGQKALRWNNIHAAMGIHFDFEQHVKVNIFLYTVKTQNTYRR